MYNYKKNRLKIILKSIFLIFIISSCNIKTPVITRKVELKKYLDNKIHFKNKQDYQRKCFTEKDTIFNENNYLKYVLIDTFFHAKIRIGGKDTILGYCYDCSSGLIPDNIEFKNNSICFKIGYGFHYRKYVYLENINNKIIIKNFETALAIDMKRNILAYLDETDNKIIIENLKNGKKQIFESHYSPSFTQYAEIIQNKLKLKFSDGEELIINFKM